MIETVCGLVVIIAVVMIAHGALTQRANVESGERLRRVLDDAKAAEARRAYIRAHLDT